MFDSGVFAILNGSGTTDHAAVEPFLNAEGVPDLFVGSGCTCWYDPPNNGSFPWTFGWQPSYVIEGKLLGQYVSQYQKLHPASSRVGYVYENQTLGTQAVEGVDEELNASTVVTRQSYQSPTAQISQADSVVSALKNAGVQVAVVMADPELTALTLLAAAQASYRPQWVVISEGADPDTLAALLETYGAGTLDVYGPKASPQTIETGLISDTYLPLPSDTSNPWIALFAKIHDRYIPNLPFDSYVVDGMAVGYTFYALVNAVGTNLTRSSLMHAIQTADLNGPNLTPYAYTSGSHQGMTGGQIAIDENGVLTATGPVYVTGDHGGLSIDSTTPPAPPQALR